MTEAKGKAGWQKIARRVRVPLGFAVAAVFLAATPPAWPDCTSKAAVLRNK